MPPSTPGLPWLPNQTQRLAVAMWGRCPRLRFSARSAQLARDGFQRAQPVALCGSSAASSTTINACTPGACAATTSASAGEDAITSCTWLAAWRSASARCFSRPSGSASTSKKKWLSHRSSTRAVPARARNSSAWARVAAS